MYNNTEYVDFFLLFTLISYFAAAVVLPNNLIGFFGGFEQLVTKT